MGLLALAMVVTFIGVFSDGRFSIRENFVRVWTVLLPNSSRQVESDRNYLSFAKWLMNAGTKLLLLVLGAQVIELFLVTIGICNENCNF